MLGSSRIKTRKRRHWTRNISYGSGLSANWLSQLKWTSSQRVHIDGVGALDIETHPRGFFDRRIDWKGQKRSKMTGSRRATDLIEHYDAFSSFAIYYRCLAWSLSLPVLSYTYDLTWNGSRILFILISWGFFRQGVFNRFSQLRALYRALKHGKTGKSRIFD